VLSNQDVRNFLIDFIQRSHSLPKGDEIDSIDLFATGYVDSMAVIRLVVELESMFDVRIEEEDIVSTAFRTVAGIANLVKKKQGL